MPIAVLAVAAVMPLLVGAPAPSSSAAAAGARDDSADALLFWLRCDKVDRLSNKQLDTWKHLGVDGFVCMAGHLRGMGGTQAFTGNDRKSLTARKYRFQRTLRTSKIVQRARARGMKMYLGADLSNYWNSATPLSNWFNGAGWARLVLPDVRRMAAAARRLGFAGVAFDQELYPQRGGATTATWDWDYPGNTHSQAEVRAKARQRGRELMSAVVSGYPGAEVVAHGVEFPGTWSALVQKRINGIQNAFASRLDIDFWEGLLGVKGYSAVRLFDATFYKSPQFGSWHDALQYNASSLAGLLSRRIRDWKYAASRVSVSPSSWIDPGPNPGPFDDARSPRYVRRQLLAFRKWGMDGEFANYVYGHLDSGNYRRYAHAMKRASSPAKVDSVAPTVATRWKVNRARSATITGTAHDNLAVWVVRWRDDRGHSGTARLDSSVPGGGGDRSAGGLRTTWSIPVAALGPGATRVTIVAADIKGNRSARATARVTG